MRKFQLYLCQVGFEFMTIDKVTLVKKIPFYFVKASKKIYPDEEIWA